MRYLQAGDWRLVALEPDHDLVRNLVKQAGFEGEVREDSRRLVVEIRPGESARSILLFDAREPANLGWFSRCQFYVDAFSGSVLQTPLTVANARSNGKVASDRLLIALSTELPAGFRMPGKQGVSEQVVYSLLFNLLNALRENGVAICGKGGVQPLAGSLKRRPSR